LQRKACVYLSVVMWSCNDKRHVMTLPFTHQDGFSVLQKQTGGGGRISLLCWVAIQLVCLPAGTCA
jgi:hypothetical protein